MSLRDRVVNSHLRQFILLLLGATLIRAYTFHGVTVNGDTGLYLYDAKQLLWGRQIFVDFPSRSPAMEWLIAGAIALGDSPIIAARTLMVTVSLALAVGVYALARELDGHRAGMLAAGLFAYSPFVIVWGTWVKTEQVAGLVVVAAFVLALRVIDREQMGLAVPVAIGLLFALAWQIRRVVIVHIGAFTLFVIWYRYRQQSELRSTVRPAAVVVTTALAATMLAYAAIAGWDIARTVDVANTHGLALFLSSGQGSLGWVGLDNAQAVTAASGGGIIAQLCQKCGINTFEVFHRTLLVTLPLVAVWLVFLRSYVREGAAFWGEKAMPAMLGVLGLYATTKAVSIGDGERVLQGLTITLAIGSVWLTPAVEWKRLWRPKLALPVIVLVTLTAGYLYRDRMLYVTYFQDFYPYVCAVGGIVLVEYWDAIRSSSTPWSGISTERYRRLVVIVVLLTTVATANVAANNAYAYQPDGVDDSVSWHTIDLIQTYGEDIDQRTEPGERVFAAQPLYVVESDRKIAGNLSRKFYAFRGWPNSTKTNQTAAELAAQLRSGNVTVAVTDEESRIPLEWNQIRHALQANYCRVDSPDYEQTGGKLFVYQPNASDSECEKYVHTEPVR